MSIKNIVLFIILTFLFIGGAYFLVAGGNKPEVKVTSYSSKDKEKPIVEVKKTLFDFGSIKVSEQKETTFTIKNIGTKPLQVSNMATSCHCTHGQFIYQGKTSEEYGMSDVSDVLPEILPNTEAKIKVIYRPYEMPAYGPVERELYLNTNDPNNQKLIFQVTAKVQ